MSQFSKYDSEFCGNIPIHIINAVQDYGVLLVLDKTLVIQQASENADRIFNITVRELTGKPIQDIMPGIDWEKLQQYAAGTSNGKITTVWNNHYMILHFKADMLLMEIEVAAVAGEAETSFTKLYQEIRNSIHLIEAADSVQAVGEVAATELKRVSGFDKVMIYVFDSDWNGNVMAEAMESDMESFLGFTFPASDIPKPARDLYLKNPYRFIPDRTFVPMKLFPVINPITQSFLDMSDCNVRAVAAVHVEYLKNMHVTASMSVRIIKDGALWGLIACHHKTARTINSQLCAVMELLSSVISARISALEHKSFHDLHTKLNTQYTQLVEKVYQADNLVQSLLEGKPDILRLFSATGVVITYHGRTHTRGDVPAGDQIEDLLLWLHLKQLKKVYHTDALQSVYDITEQYRTIASGMLVIPIQAAQDEYIILFRPELIRTTNWGGNPEERIFFDKNPQIYHPRHSFKLWQEYVKGFSRPWLNEEVITAGNIRSFIFELLSPASDT